MIPKVLHRIWIGGELPPEFARYGETWREHHPGWKHLLWTEEELRRVLSRASRQLYERAAAYAPKNIGQFKADIGRYEILASQGGVYVDTDFECRRPLDQLIAGAECFAAWETQAVWIGNAIMGAVPGHPFIKALVAGLGRNVHAMRGNRPNKLTGPQYLTPVYRREGKGVTVFDKSLFYPYLYNELGRAGEAFPGAYAVHHWNNARRKVAS